MKKQSFMHSSLILIISAIIAKAAGAVFKIPLTNILGGTGMGYFGSAYGLFLPVYAIAVTGLAASVAKLTAEYSALGMFKSVRKIKKTAMLMFSLIGIIGTLIIILLAKPFALHAVNSEKSYLSILMIAPTLFTGCIISVYRGYYEGLRNMYPTGISQAVEAIAKIALGLSLCIYVLNNPDKVLAILPNGTDVASAAAAAAVLGITLSSLTGMIWIMIQSKICGDGITESDMNKEKNPLGTRKISKELIRILIPISIGSLVINMTSLIDLATIIRFLNHAIESSPEYFKEKFPFIVLIGEDEFANFVYGSFTGLTVTIFNLVPSITNMFGKSILPSVAEAWAKKDSPLIKRNAEAVLSATSFLAVPCGLGITALSYEILSFIYPQRINEIAVSWESLMYSGLGVIMLCLSFPIFSMLQGIGRADLPVKIMAVGISVKLPLNIILISMPKINVSGAAISTFFCYLVITVLSLIAFTKETKIKLSLKSTILPPFYGGIMCALSARLSYDMLDYKFTSSHMLLPLSVAIGGGVYLISLYLLNVPLKSFAKKS